MSDHDIMTVGEVADWLRVDKSHVYKMARKGLIPGRQVGSAWRFSRELLQRWFEGVSSATVPEGGTVNEQP